MSNIIKNEWVPVYETLRGVVLQTPQRINWNQFFSLIVSCCFKKG